MGIVCLPNKTGTPEMIEYELRVYSSKLKIAVGPFQCDLALAAKQHEWLHCIYTELRTVSHLLEHR